MAQRSKSSHTRRERPTHRAAARRRAQRPGRAAAAPAAELAPPPEASASEAGLRYVTDAAPGIARRRRGRGFDYRDARGRPVRDAATRERIAALAIPPAWTEVWICPDPDGHLQATGRDARGRKQHRYHPRWHEVRDATKFGRMLAFAAALPKIRARVEADLAKPGHPREKVLAAVVKLLESTGIRVGNDEYSRANGSYGLTTMENRHADVTGSTMRFSFRGKSGKTHEVELSDRRLARIVQRCQDLPGEQLFGYVGDDGTPVDVGSADVNAYLREIAGDAFTAKDFRTWAGTMLAVAELAGVELPGTKKDARSVVLAAIDRVAAQLNNTRAVCRKYYVHPAVVDAFEAGRLRELLADAGTGPSGAAAGAAGLSADEKAIVRLLERWTPP